jgi:hypothetical protein
MSGTPNLLENITLSNDKEILFNLHSLFCVCSIFIIALYFYILSFHKNEQKNASIENIIRDSYYFRAFKFDIYDWIICLVCLGVLKYSLFQPLFEISAESGDYFVIHPHHKSLLTPTQLFCKIVLIIQWIIYAFQISYSNIIKNIAFIHTILNLLSLSWIILFSKEIEGMIILYHTFSLLLFLKILFDKFKKKKNRVK